jgi:hypothetical protein
VKPDAARTTPGATADHRVVAVAAVSDIVAVERHDAVVTRATLQRVVVGAADELVRRAVATAFVRAAVAPDHVAER